MHSNHAFLLATVFATATVFACENSRHAGRADHLPKALIANGLSKNGVSNNGVSKNNEYWVTPALSGSWYNATRSGEGFSLQILPDGRALMIWFTYPGVGVSGEQAWLIDDSGKISGNKISFDNVYRPQGGVFGASFNAANVTRPNWGKVEIEFSGCNQAEMRFEGPSGWGSGGFSLERLTELNELGCAGERKLTTTGARALSGMVSKSGAWFVNSRSGEGWVIEDLPDGRALVFWFTYDPQGRQAWLLGTGTRTASGIRIAESTITRGAKFGGAFRAADVQRIGWGSLQFDFRSCQNGSMSYASSIAGYTPATYDTARLTTLASEVCIDETPVAKRRGTFAELPRVPSPGQAEFAGLAYQDQVYLLGGFGDPNGFKTFNPATNTWRELPDLPSSRDHLAAFALNGSIYAVGGSLTAANTQNPGNDLQAAFRFDVAGNRWVAQPDVRLIYGSHAAMLNGKAYIGSDDATLQEFDPFLSRARTIEPPLNSAPRDHSQVVAFQGEIWMLGGRFLETTAVTIYNPVSGKWRPGPSLRNSRAGFAATVIDQQILVAGGEVLTGLPTTLQNTEIFTAGQESWQQGPLLPFATHGNAVAAIGDQLYFLMGPGRWGFAPPTGRVFSLRLVP